MGNNLQKVFRIWSMSDDFGQGKRRYLTNDTAPIVHRPHIAAQVAPQHCPILRVSNLSVDYFCEIIPFTRFRLHTPYFYQKVNV